MENQEDLESLESIGEIDELIVQHPGFRASVERARLQKQRGQVKSLEEIRRKYAQVSE